MENAKISQLLEHYDENQGLLDDFRLKAETLIGELLIAEGLEVSSVTSRLKERHSFEIKISRADSAYAAFSDITDVVGLRVITYFANDVNRVAKVIEREFTLDRANCVDKRTSLEANQFGYLSLHDVVEITPSRSKLTEWRRFKGLKAEIQIRSMLQHTWAEIEHDLGYGGKVTTIPVAFRRRFSRLAGVLELADDEFQALREGLLTYQGEVERQVKATNLDIPLDTGSLRAYINTSALIKRIDLAILREGVKIEPVYEGAPHAYAEVLQDLGFQTISAIDKALSKRELVVINYGHEIWGDTEKKTTAPGLAIHYLIYTLLNEQGEGAFYQHMLKHASNPNDRKERDVASFMRAAYLEALQKCEAKSKKS